MKVLYKQGCRSLVPIIKLSKYNSGLPSLLGDYSEILLNPEEKLNASHVSKTNLLLLALG